MDMSWSLGGTRRRDAVKTITINVPQRMDHEILDPNPLSMIARNIYIINIITAWSDHAGEVKRVEGG